MSQLSMTTIIFEGGGSRISICMLQGHPSMMPGDTYVLKTHKTDFNPRVECDIPDGTYVVTKREWIHHMANVNSPMLHIHISTFPAKRAT